MKNNRAKRGSVAVGVFAVGLIASGLLYYRPTLAQTAAAGGRDPADQEHPAPFAHRVAITTEGETRVIKANGIPDHPVGTFPRRNNPNTLAEQSYAFRMPLTPHRLTQARPVGRYLEGVALNGVPFDPSTAEFWNGDRQLGWNYEAIFGTLNLGLDGNNAHVQPGGAYHYHGLPTGLMKSLKAGTHVTLLGYAADGFPIYGPYCPSDPNDLKSPLRAMKSSYRLKSGTRPAGDDGPGGVYDGTFTQDYEYVAKLGDLDEANGRTGVTPEYPHGTYYYVLSENWPVVRASSRARPTPASSTARPAEGGAAGRWAGRVAADRPLAGPRRLAGRPRPAGLRLRADRRPMDHRFSRTLPLDPSPGLRESGSPPSRTEDRHAAPVFCPRRWTLALTQTRNSFRGRGNDPCLFAVAFHDSR